MDVDDDLRVAQPDHVTVCQLPLLHRRVVDGGAVSGVEIRQQRDVAVPTDLQVAARHTGVRQPELGVLAATDDVGAVAQLVGAPAAVVELQGDRGPRGRVAALPVAAAVAAALGGLTILVVTPRRLAVPAAVCRSGRLAVTAVVGLLAVVLTPVALVIAATLLGVGCPLVGCGIAALIVAGRSAAIVGVLAVTLATGLAGAALAVAGVVTLAAAIAAGRPLFILRVAALVGVAAALVGVAALFGVAAALLGVAALLRVAALFGVAAALVGVAAALVGVAAALFGVPALLGIPALLRIAALGGRRGRITVLVGVAALLRRIGAALLRRIGTSGVLAGPRVVLRMPVLVVVIVVAGPPLPLAAAVARVLGHRWYSWFCAERMF